MADEVGAPRWGVLGTGARADAFVRALRVSGRAGPVAVGARSLSRARGFAERWGVDGVHGGCAGLVADRAVEAVFVATPSPWHHAHALSALGAGKHVLVDGPLGVNALQVAQVVAAARASGCLLVEGSVVRHLPVHRAVRDLVAGGGIGRVESVHAEVGAGVSYEPGQGVFDVERGGGALSVLGAHPLSLVSWYLGELTVVGAARRLAPDRMVDVRTTVLAHGGGGAMATFSCVSGSGSSDRAVVCGSGGRVEFDRFWCASDAVVHRVGCEPEVVRGPFEADGVQFLVEEFVRCLVAGEVESPLMPWVQSRSLAEVVDRVRDVGVLGEGELRVVGAG